MKSSLLWYSMATLVHSNRFARVVNVWLAADNAGIVLKKYGKTSFFDSSPEAADGETYEKRRINNGMID